MTTTPCPRNLPQHFNGCTCTAVPGSLLAEATDISLYPEGSFYPDGSPRAYSLLAEPEKTVTPDGTHVYNYMAAPADTDDGIFGYGGSASDRPMSWVEDELPGIPGRAFPFSGSVGARDGAILMSVSGTARSHGEAWDRMGAPKAEWADKYDLRPSKLRIDAEPNEAADRHDAAVKIRLAAADELNAAIKAYKKVGGWTIMPAARRRKAEAIDRVEAAWTSYQEAYPYAKAQGSHPMVSS